MHKVLLWENLIKSIKNEFRDQIGEHVIWNLLKLHWVKRRFAYFHIKSVKPNVPHKFTTVNLKQRYPTVWPPINSLFLWFIFNILMLFRFIILSFHPKSYWTQRNATRLRISIQIQFPTAEKKIIYEYCDIIKLSFVPCNTWLLEIDKILLLEFMTDFH